VNHLTNCICHENVHGTWFCPVHGTYPTEPIRTKEKAVNALQTASDLFLRYSNEIGDAVDSARCDAASLVLQTVLDAVRDEWNPELLTAAVNTLTTTMNPEFQG